MTLGERAAETLTKILEYRVCMPEPVDIITPTTATDTSARTREYSAKVCPPRCDRHFADLMIDFISYYNPLERPLK